MVDPIPFTLAAVLDRLRQRTPRTSSAGELLANVSWWLDHSAGTPLHESAWVLDGLVTIDNARIGEAPYLAAIGYLVDLGVCDPDPMLSDACARVTRRTANTVERTGYADDPVVLAGLWLLARKLGVDAVERKLERHARTVTAASDALSSVVALLTLIDATVATTVRPFAARDAVDIAVAVCIASQHPAIANQLFPYLSLAESYARLMSCACAGELESVDGLSSSFAAVGLSIAIDSSTRDRRSATTTTHASLRLGSVAELRGNVDAVILTIRQDEHDAVLRRVFNGRNAKGRRFYTIASVPMAHGRDACVVLLRIPEPGTGPAQDAARDAIEDFAPHVIALVGIGGAVPSSEFSLGDVMLTTRLADLRVQALRYGASPQSELRGERVQKALADLLVNLPAAAVEGWSSATSLGGAVPQVPLDDDRFDGPEAFRSKVRESLERRFGSRRPVRSPLYWTGTTGSGDSLVRDPEAVAHWQEACRKIEVFEMEAAGVFEAAARPDKSYPVLVIRGVSDVIGYRRDPDWTAFACDAAAAFATALISSGLLETIRS